MIFDATYTSDAAAWLLVWVGLGLSGRMLLARADQRRASRRHDQNHEKVTN